MYIVVANDINSNSVQLFDLRSRKVKKLDYMNYREIAKRGLVLNRKFAEGYVVQNCPGYIHVLGKYKKVYYIIFNERSGKLYFTTINNLYTFGNKNEIKNASVRLAINERAKPVYSVRLHNSKLYDLPDFIMSDDMENKLIQLRVRNALGKASYVSKLTDICDISTGKILDKYIEKRSKDRIIEKLYWLDLRALTIELENMILKKSSIRHIEECDIMLMVILHLAPDLLNKMDRIKTLRNYDVPKTPEVRLAIEKEEKEFSSMYTYFLKQLIMADNLKQ